MRFSVKLDLPNIDVKKYNKAVKTELKRGFRRAVKAFVRAAVPHIPVQTGMTRGSFINISKFLNIALNIPRGRRFRRRFRRGRFYREEIRWYYPPGKSGARLPKTPQTGANLSMFEINDEFPLNFKFQSKVLQYNLLDMYYGSSPTAPWKSIKAGREAFNAEMRKVKDSIPKIEKFITITRISIGYGSGGITENKFPFTERQQRTYK